MKYSDLPHWSALAAKWAADYHDTLRDRPVRPRVRPGEITAQLPVAPPDDPDPMDTIFDDFTKVVPDAMTHWQHPRFMAYFTSNAAPASMLAEQLANAISAQCMLWQTSPAATEIEVVMIDWLRQALGLRDGFVGTIHDSATTATLSAILTMRERALDWRGLQTGLTQEKPIRIYASAQTHSSIDKAVRLAGIGQDNLVKIPTNDVFAMDTAALDRAIRADLKAGYLPAGVVGCTGGTSIGACDDIKGLIEVARAHDLYTHVDAAWAGSAMICPEFRHLWDGVDNADSIVFNPHKWLGANFDCAVQFLADPKLQIQTLGLRPDYLQTLEQGEVTDFNEWTVPLGRRFRALKLWFLIRAYGLEGLRSRIRNHVAWTQMVAKAVAAIPGCRITTQPILNLFSFAHETDATTRKLLEAINEDGRIYLTQTIHDGQFVIRVTMGQFEMEERDAQTAIDVISQHTAALGKSGA